MHVSTECVYNQGSLALFTYYLTPNHNYNIKTNDCGNYRWQLNNPLLLSIYVRDPLW